MAKLRRVIGWVDQSNRGIAGVVCYIGFLLMLAMAYEVVARYVFNRPTSWSLELTQFMFCAMIALGAGWGLLAGSYINVDIIYERFSPRTKAIVNMITYLLTFFFLGIVIWQSWSTAMLALKLGETSGSGWDPPIYHVKFLIPVGAALLFIQCITRFIKNTIQAVSGIEESTDRFRL